MIIVLVLFSCIVLSIGLKFSWPIFSFKSSLYSKETKLGYFKVIKDKGLSGEYFISRILEKTKGYHRIIVNCYVPKGNGHTTEVDIVLIHTSGIYVLESKNYGGWIFGDEKNFKWCQMFPNQHKEFFYNPILQNQMHVESLRVVLPKKIPMTSIIVFSDRCELKKMNVVSKNVYVLQKKTLKAYLSQLMKKAPSVLTKKEVDTIYQVLKPYCNVSEAVKQKHAKEVEKIQKATNDK